MIKLITPPGMLLTVALMAVYAAYALRIGWIERSWVLFIVGLVTIVACYGTAMLRPWSQFLVYLLTGGFLTRLFSSIYSGFSSGYFDFQFSSASEGLRSLAPSLLMAMLSCVCAFIVYQHFRDARTAGRSGSR